MEEKLQLKSQVCFPIYSLSREIINRYRPFLDELDITYPQYLVLMVLWENEVQTVNQIGEKLNLDSGTLTPLLKRLEAKELIHRCRRRSDERVVEITLTEKASSLKSKAVLVPEKVVNDIGLTSEDLEDLKRIVTKILNKTKNLP
ncbi:MarR family transcriptional regulator [Maribellus sp. CM-23]|uniref:MarR family winged helix-turn-helix transcriptional regulator n=1 Tax=Maribellus sp. CM-23 TaxID=2781026 RepID=UPI001F1DF015|nr:MarR family transcriptional regulator [Maribellus sp. CM-23]MCE4563135.1 MarR family transcriptional regulator [Maribellus sp. CM-23]